MKIIQRLKLHTIEYFPDSILNFLLITGCFCGFLSAFGITYYGIIVFPVLFLMSFVCAYIYHCNSLQRMLFYFLLLLVFFVIIVRYSLYVNSGFYILVNRIVDDFSTFLNISSYQEYRVIINDQKTAVTFLIICFSFLFLPLINIFAAEKKNIIGAFLSTMPLLCIPLYIHAEPAVQWQAALISGYILILSGKYMKKVTAKYNPKKFTLLKISFFGMTYVVILLCLIIIHLLFPQHYYDETYEENTYKTAGYDNLSTFLMFGFSGFFNDYEAVGGMSGGKLGGINSVRPDYQTDLIVEFAPYSEETLYLKGFTGVTYTGKQWITEHDSEYRLWENENAYQNLEESFLNGDKQASSALLRLRNVGASIRYEYVPYYTEYSTFDESVYDEAYCEYYFYPYHEVKDAVYYDEPEEAYLEVPKANKRVIETIMINEDIHGDTDEVLTQLKKYFSENYTYSMSPGKTPAKEDYVNYFLTESKKGYCSHFASSAVLMLRSLGIPARYVEGYALQAYKMAEGTLQNNLEYDDFYRGYNALGETGVIRCEIDDSQAHAWVEYWDADFGWRVAEFTPPSEGAEEYSDFWTNFSSILDSGAFHTGGNIASSAVQTSNDVMHHPALRKGISTGLNIIKIVFLMIFILLILHRLINFWKRYYSGNKRGNLLRLYGDVYRLSRKKFPEFRSCYSHKEQLQAIQTRLVSERNNNGQPTEYEKLSELLEQLTYSGKSWNELMTNQEYRKYQKLLFSIKRKLFWKKC